jgi:hypothetical protein
VIYYTTPREQRDDYEIVTHEQREERLSQCRFRKTWFIRAGTNAGKGTLNAPFPKSPHLRLWTGKLSANEFNDLILATGIRLDTNGYLTKESMKIASQLTMPHEAINTIEDEKEIQSQLQISNTMYAYAEHFECNCTRCRKLWNKSPRRKAASHQTATSPHPGHTTVRLLQRLAENQQARMNTHRGT